MSMSSSNGISIVYFIATTFGLRPFIYTVARPLHCYSLYIIYMLFFLEILTMMFSLYMLAPAAV